MENKDTDLYFSHDYNARHDPKILEMRSVYSFEGYGLYFALVEIMRGEKDSFKLKISGKYSINALALDLSYDKEKLSTFINDCINEFHLFESDGDYIWSNSLLKRMEKKDEIREKRRKAAEARWGKQDNDSDGEKNSDENDIQEDTTVDANALQEQSKCIALKESKINEIKENEIKEKENKLKVNSADGGAKADGNNGKKPKDTRVLRPEEDILLKFKDIDPDIPNALGREPPDDYILNAKRTILKYQKQLVRGEVFQHALRVACDNLKDKEWFWNSGGLYWLLDCRNGQYNGAETKNRIAKYMVKAKSQKQIADEQYQKIREKAEKMEKKFGRKT